MLNLEQLRLVTVYAKNTESKYVHFSSACADHAAVCACTRDDPYHLNSAVGLPKCSVVNPTTISKTHK